jgi:hypothetical protein
MKKSMLHLVTMLVLGLVSVGSTALAQSKVDDKLFSYTAPKGWTVRDFPGVASRISHAPPANGFAANINVVNEKAPMPLDKYLVAAEKQLKTLPGFKSGGSKPFSTAKGIKGVRVIYEQEAQGKKLRQLAYVFPGKSGLKFVVTMSALSSDGTKYDTQFDAAAKTFIVK